MGFNSNSWQQGHGLEVYPHITTAANLSWTLTKLNPKTMANRLPHHPCHSIFLHILLSQIEAEV